jgi:hypothetical protein
MSDYAWVSQIFSPKGWPNFEAHYVGRDFFDPDPGVFRRRYTGGEPLGREYFPDEMSLDLHPEYENWPAARFQDIQGLKWAADEESTVDATITAFPEIAKAGRNVVISARCLEIFRRFDMGNIAFYPIKLFQSDHKTRIGDDWFCMTFANVKQVFVPNKTPNTLRNGDAQWGLYSSLEDYEMELSAAARQGPEIWVDPYLFGSVLFLSGPLGDALTEAGMLDGLAPVCKTRIIS